MQRYTKTHVDGSEAIIYETNSSWQVQLVIPHAGNWPSIVARHGDTLEQAKMAADQAVEHHCIGKCGEWVLSVPEDEKQLSLFRN
jgi:hypothetical protein